MTFQVYTQSGRQALGLNNMPICAETNYECNILYAAGLMALMEGNNCTALHLEKRQEIGSDYDVITLIDGE